MVLSAYTIGAAFLPEDIRYDGMNHILGSTTQGRCKFCQKNTKNMCKKCNVRLHAERGKELKLKLKCNIANKQNNDRDSIKLSSVLPSYSMKQSLAYE